MIGKMKDMKIGSVFKLVVIFMTVGLTMFLVCSCSNSSKEPKVADIFSAITEKYPLSEAMSEVKGEEKVKSVYGFDPKDYNEIAACVNNSGTQQDEIVIVKAVDAAAADGIINKLNNRLTAKLNSTKNYLPQQYDIVRKCEVTKKGLYVRMIVSPDAEEVAKIFDAQF